MKDLKKKVTEIVEIAKQVPENLQQSCFEILLKELLKSDSPPTEKREKKTATDSSETDEKPKAVDESSKSQDDLVDTDLHVKVKRFLSKHSLGVEHLNNLFYKEDDEILPLYEDLATTRASEGQLRISLLQALRKALHSGEFEFEVEAVRKECKDRKYYDSPNFAANIKNNIELFDIDAYSRDTKSAKLSDKGKRELAEVIQELQ